MLSLRMLSFRPRAIARAEEPAFPAVLLLLHDRAIPIPDQPRARSFRVFDVGIRTELNPKYLVVIHRSRGHERRIIFLLERIHERVGIFLLGDGRDLHEISA